MATWEKNGVNLHEKVALYEYAFINTKHSQTISRLIIIVQGRIQGGAHPARLP